MEKTDEVGRLFIALFHEASLSLAGMLPLVLGRESRSDAALRSPAARWSLGMMGILALVKLCQPRLPNAAFCRVHSGISVSSSPAAGAPGCMYCR